MAVDRKTTIEALVESKKGAVDYLKEKGVRCIRCGEPIWGTLEDAARQKGFSDEEIERMVEELEALD